MLDRKSPCSTCPFRTTPGAFRHLGTERATEIAESLLSGAGFTCHTDIDKSRKARNQCAGAMLILDKLDQHSSIMQVAARLGMFNAADLRGHADVFDNFDDWVIVQAEE